MNTNKKQDILGIVLAGVVGIALIASMAIRAFFPRIIIPKLDGIAMVFLSLTALVTEYYAAREKSRDYRLIPIYAALIFGVFPWAACFAEVVPALKNALIGGVIFTVTAFLFDKITDRLQTNFATSRAADAAARLAPIAGAVGLFLAAQCLLGIV